MPIVVYQTISYNFLYAKGCRICCAHCDKPFTYITGAVAEKQVRGLPYVSLVMGHEGMRKSALGAGKQTIRKFARKKRTGSSVCPHCHRYQAWMVRRSRVNCMLGGAACGALVAAALLSSVLTMWWVWRAIGGAAVGAIAGFFMALREGPHSVGSDPSSKTDEDLCSFLAACDNNDTDPFVEWWTTAGKVSWDTEKTVVASLGLEDSVGGFPIPPESTTAHVLSPEGFLGKKGGDLRSPLRELRVRIRAEVIRSENGYEYIYNHLEIKGAAPVVRETQLGFAVSVLDVSGLVQHTFCKSLVCA